MRLSGPQLKQIKQALLAAYDESSLRQMLREEMNAQLDQVAGGETMEEIVFNLIEWAERKGRIQELINAAYRHNPGNPQLYSLASGLKNWPEVELHHEPIYTLFIESFNPRPSGRPRCMIIVLSFLITIFIGVLVISLGYTKRLTLPGTIVTLPIISTPTATSSPTLIPTWTPVPTESSLNETPTVSSLPTATSTFTPEVITTPTLAPTLISTVTLAPTVLPTLALATKEAKLNVLAASTVPSTSMPTNTPTAIAPPTDTPTVVAPPPLTPIATNVQLTATPTSIPVLTSESATASPTLMPTNTPTVVASPTDTPTTTALPTSMPTDTPTVVAPPPLTPIATNMQLTATPTSIPVLTSESATSSPTLLQGHIAVSILKNSNFILQIYDLTNNAVTFSQNEMRQPDFSLGGFLAANDENGALVRMDSDGGNLRAITKRGEDAHPHWSPDASAIVYDSDENGTTIIHLLRVTREAQNAPFLPDPAGGALHGRNPVFLSNGRVAFNGCNSWENGGSCGIFSIETDGKNVQRISDQPQDIPTDNLHSRILFMSDRGGNWDIYIADEGGNIQQLTNHPARDGLPTASPDGQYVAFVSDRDGSWGVYVMKVDGSDQQKLFSLNGGYGTGDKDWTQEKISWGP